MKKSAHFIALFFLFIAVTDSLQAQNEIQRVRIDFETPLGYVRHLILGFTPDNAATDGFDYGYDAANIEDHPDDMNWMIDGNRYVIQGVGEFDISKYYPLGIFLTNEGNVSISLASLENFFEPINVYIYNIETDNYTLINQNDFSIDLLPGDYTEQFYITFTEPAPISSTLADQDHTLNPFKMRYNNGDHTLRFDPNNRDIFINKVSIYNFLGQEILNKNIARGGRFDIKLNSISTRQLLIKIESELGIHYKRIAF